MSKRKAPEVFGDLKKAVAQAEAKRAKALELYECVGDTKQKLLEAEDLVSPKGILSKDKDPLRFLMELRKVYHRTHKEASAMFAACGPITDAEGNKLSVRADWGTNIPFKYTEKFEAPLAEGVTSTWATVDTDDRITHIKD